LEGWKIGRGGRFGRREFLLPIEIQDRSIPSFILCQLLWKSDVNVERCSKVNINRIEELFND
jgi:hypothetical protein